MKLLFLLLLPSFLVAQGQEFIILDAQSKTPVPYACIDFMNGFVIFTNAEGKATIEDPAVHKVKISSLGYLLRVVATTDLKGEVYLDPAAIELEEVIIEKNKKSKTRTNVVKPVLHQKNDLLYMSGIGLQYAFLVPYKSPESYLNAIALPLIKIAFEAEGNSGVFHKIPFRTLVKIEILENKNSSPGNKLNGLEQIVVVNNTADDERHDIILDEYVEIPAEGFFVQLTILGRADANGNLINQLPYDRFKDGNGSEVRMKKYLQPNFPLTKQPNGTSTFVRYIHDENAQWQVINAPHLSQNIKYPDFNIGFGYTTINFK